MLALTIADASTLLLQSNHTKQCWRVHVFDQKRLKRHELLLQSVFSFIQAFIFGAFTCVIEFQKQQNQFLRNLIQQTKGILCSTIQEWINIFLCQMGLG